MKRKSEYYPPFKDEGEVVASWGQAQLIKYLDGKSELKGGSKEDRLAEEWMSLFWHEAVGEGGRAVSCLNAGPSRRLLVHARGLARTDSQKRQAKGDGSTNPRD